MNYLRERVLEPILIPLAAAALIAFGALNLSRLFLASAHDDRAVVVASLISAGILGGAAWATSRERIERGTLLMGAALAGLVLGSAGLVAQQVDRDREREAEGGGPAVAGEITVVASNFKFDQEVYETAGPGIQVDYVVDEGSHTFVVEGFEAEFKLEAGAGATDSGVTELQPDDYVFYCDVPGHRAAGMEATLTVT